MTRQSKKSSGWTLLIVLALLLPSTSSAQCDMAGGHTMGTMMQGHDMQSMNSTLREIHDLMSQMQQMIELSNQSVEALSQMNNEETQHKEITAVVLKLCTGINRFGREMNGILSQVQIMLSATKMMEDEDMSDQMDNMIDSLKQMVKEYKNMLKASNGLHKGYEKI